MKRSTRKRFESASSSDWKTARTNDVTGIRCVSCWIRSSRAGDGASTSGSGLLSRLWKPWRRTQPLAWISSIHPITWSKMCSSRAEYTFERSRKTFIESATTKPSVASVANATASATHAASHRGSLSWQKQSVIGRRQLACPRASARSRTA